MRIVITGASGVVGALLRKHYTKEREKSDGSTNYTIVAICHPNDQTSYKGGPALYLDLAKCSPSEIARAFDGAEAVIHLSALSSALTPWEDVLNNNIALDQKVFQACILAKVRRIVYASSNHINHIVTMKPPPTPASSWDPNNHDPRFTPPGGISLHDPISPDSYYAVGKVFGEALGRHYSARYGLEVVCLRIGWIREDDDPTTVSADKTEYIRAIYLSHEDCVGVFDCALRVPLPLLDVSLRVVHGCPGPGGKAAPFLVAYAVSHNRRGIFDTRTGNKALGFAPHSDSERFFLKKSNL